MRLREGDEPIPGYRLIRKLGRGGFGIVWQAEGPGGIRSAIKIIDLTVGHGRKELRAIQRVKSIVHPNLVPIQGIWLTDDRGQLLSDRESLEGALQTRAIASDEETVLADAVETSEEGPGELLIAMGLCEQSLHDRLLECSGAGQGGIPSSELIAYLHDAARGIDFLNSPVHDLGDGLVGIQHCDIKPGNLMIVGGAVQVCDFGLARVLQDARHTALAYTPAYAAPELIHNNEPSAATDQYSLAVSYLELRCGRLPFDNASHFEIAKIHTEGTLDLAALPDEERAVIARAVSKDPSDRFACSIEMIDALRGAMQSDGRLILPPVPVRRGTPVPRQLSTTVEDARQAVTKAEGDPAEHRADTSERIGWRRFLTPRTLILGLLGTLVVGGVLGVLLVVSFDGPPGVPEPLPPLQSGGAYPNSDLQNQLHAMEDLIEEGHSYDELIGEIRDRFDLLEKEMFESPLNQVEQADLQLMKSLSTDLGRAPTQFAIDDLQSQRASASGKFESTSKRVNEMVGAILDKAQGQPQ